MPHIQKLFEGVNALNRIYFVRHGKNPANVLRIFSHKIVDYSLNDYGIKQAEACENFFKPIKVDGIFSSTLKRAIETGEIIGRSHELTVVPMENFLEIDAGNLEGKTIDEETLGFYHEVINDWFNGNKERKYPGGENFFQLLDRFKTGLGEITREKKNQNLVVVSHYGALISTLPWLCGNIDPLSFHKTKLGITMTNCAITEVTIATKGNDLELTLENWASTEHLSLL